VPIINQKLNVPLTEEMVRRIKLGIEAQKVRAKTLCELASGLLFYAASVPLSLTDKAAEVISDEANAQLLEALIISLERVKDWGSDELNSVVNELAIEKAVKLNQVAQIARAKLVGDVISPSIFDIMKILGKDETLTRLKYNY
jgi:glutamyl-tRNA synthetase